MDKFLVLYKAPNAVIDEWMKKPEQERKPDDAQVSGCLDDAVLDSPLVLQRRERLRRLLREATVSLCEMRCERRRLQRLLPTAADDRMIEPDLDADVAEQCAVRVGLHV